MLNILSYVCVECMSGGGHRAAAWTYGSKAIFTEKGFHMRVGIARQER
jgi:hypothetical protein